MYDINDNKKSFNLPAYIHAPLFLYQDNRLEKPALLIASFFYSIHTSGQKITASTDYLCELSGIHKRQYYKIMNLLEDCLYIRRSGFTNRKTIEWIYQPESKLIVTESDTSALKDTSVQKPNTSALSDTKLVHSRTLNLCTPVHTDNKEDTKDYKNTSTSENPSISFFFSSSVDRKLLSLKLPEDRRSEEEFLLECKLHVDTKSDKSNPYLKRANALAILLAKLKEQGKLFFVSGTKSQEEIKEEEKSKDLGRVPTMEEWENWKRGIKGFEWVNAWRLKQQG